MISDGFKKLAAIHTEVIVIDASQNKTVNFI